MNNDAKELLEASGILAQMALGTRTISLEELLRASTVCKRVARKLQNSDG